MLSGMNISASGLAGERTRMDVVANNIANAHSTSTPEGGPYQRQQVSFAAVMDRYQAGGTTETNSLRGVRVSGIQSDNQPPRMVYQPGHPDANAEGFVAYPDVTVASEMVDLMTASRAYEANLKSLETFRQLAEQALALLRSNR
ncbi:MAG: flagellar basal body rod protein FlgC [Planctomyces sp.]|nr:flagellar basal body rod protein FlgC [Planctomyces sp.]